MSGDRSAQRGLRWERANNGSWLCLRGIGGTTISTFCILQVSMLRFRPSRGLRPQLCRLKHLFEFTQGVRAHNPLLGYLSLRAGRNVQHPERHFQNPAVLIFQAAVRHRPASSYEARMHPYCPAMPSMEGIVDLTHVPNMGVCVAELYHREKNHQGLANRIILPEIVDAGSGGSVQRRQRL